MSPLLFTLDGSGELGERLCRSLGLEHGVIDRRRFPDGETYLRFETPVAGRGIALLCSLDRPDEKTLPLLFAAAAAREQGAVRVGVIAPYLAYMRQDRAFQAGEAVTSVAYARLLSSAFNWLLTVDPHLHRHPNLGSIYSIPAVAVSAAAPIAAWVRQQVARPFLIGPDEESAQWVNHIALLAGADAAVLQKARHGDLDVEISAESLAIPPGSTPVIVDDIMSSARTMIEAVRLVRRTGDVEPVCIGVHAILAGDAYERLREAGAGRVVTANTVLHSTNEIDVSEELGCALSSMLGSPGDNSNQASRFPLT